MARLALFPFNWPRFYVCRDWIDPKTGDLSGPPRLRACYRPVWDHPLDRHRQPRFREATARLRPAYRYLGLPSRPLSLAVAVLVPPCHRGVRGWVAVGA